MARDGFEQYFAEKLWELIPAVYREEDGLAENPGVLRSIVEIIAGQAALLRRSQDRLWDDEFIDLCAGWAVPYIGDLLGTRLISAQNPRGRRVDVAKTIYYRRRKGTPRVLEELISDITGWEGRVVEMFRRLGRARHALDPRPAGLKGRHTGTLPGGWADLRSPLGSNLTGGPFDEYHSTPDVRQFSGIQGRHGIPKLAFHLYRVPAIEVEHVKPAQGPNPKAFLMDPSGRDIQLFQPRRRSDDWEEWRPAREWELPAPMHCRVLGHSEFEIHEETVVWLEQNAALSSAAAAELRRFSGVRFATEARLRATLATLESSTEVLGATVLPQLLARAEVEDCGHAALLPEALEIESTPGTPVPAHRIAAGNLSAWSAVAPGKDVVVDPERGRVLFLNNAPSSLATLSYWYGFPAPIGSGAYGRAVGRATSHASGGGALAIPGSGTLEIDDNGTYAPAPPVAVAGRLTVQAAARKRPYLRARAPEFVFDTGAVLHAVLTLDGLWIGADAALSLVLAGDYELVTIRCCTLDPGGTDAMGNPIGAVRIVARGHVERLSIESSIVGGIGTADAGFVEEVAIQDSIVQGNVLLPDTGANFARVTAFGTVDVERLYATESLLAGAVDVTDTQEGCFRFSAARPGSRVPRPYESHFLPGGQHWFVSRKFGDYGYAQLSQTAPEALRRGAENGSGIGAYCSLMQPVKLDGLEAKAGEFAPFGLTPIFIIET